MLCVTDLRKVNVYVEYLSFGLQVSKLQSKLSFVLFDSCRSSEVYQYFCGNTNEFGILIFYID